MKKQLKDILRKRPLLAATISLTAYSLVVLLLAQPLGLHKGTYFRGYWQKPNWLFFPLYWPLVMALAYQTWHGFVDGWRGMADTGVIHLRDGGFVSKENLDGVIKSFNLCRRRLVYASIALSLIANVIDVYQWAPCYWGNNAACMQSEHDFNIAWWLNPDRSKVLDGSFVIAAYLAQVILGFLAFLALLQTLFHVAAFFVFERFDYVKRENLELTLNFRSPLNEFGLERWNHALNNTYWILSACLIIPLVSRYSQPDPTKLNPGQMLIQYLVPLILLVPMIGSIIQRQLRLPKVWEILKKPDEEGDIEKYHKQRIWPLDRNWSSKLGVIIAFMMLSYLIGTARYDEVLKKLLGQ